MTRAPTSPTVQRTPMKKHLAAILVTIMFLTLRATAAPGDRWLDHPKSFPWETGRRVLYRTTFVSLKAEVIIGQLNIFWRSASGATSQTVTLHYSPDFPGHWSAREWRTLNMRKRGDLFDAKVPVSDIDIPIVYYLEFHGANTSQISPTRLAHARSLGMEKPSTVFWPFLEGFESDMGNWQSNHQIKRDDLVAHSGKHSLQISIPSGKRSAAVATTRLRGWHFRQQNATGLRLWLKASVRDTKVRFKLTSNSQSNRAEVAPSTREATIGPTWQLVELPLSSFAVTTPGDIDRFSLEFVNEGPVHIHIDDVELTGRWRTSRSN